MVWIRGSQTTMTGASGSLMRPIEPPNWDQEHRVIVSKLMEAMSLGISTTTTWLHVFRECISVVNDVVNQPCSSEFHSDVISVVVSFRAIACGEGCVPNTGPRQSMTGKPCLDRACRVVP